jgi:hypothetical protein
MMVASSSQITFKNNDTVPHQVASTNCPELNSPSIAPGTSVTLMLDPGPKNCDFTDALHSGTSFAGSIQEGAPGMPGY